MRRCVDPKLQICLASPWLALFGRRRDGPVAPPFAQVGFGLGIPHHDGLLGAVVFPLRIFSPKALGRALGEYRDGPYRFLLPRGASYAVCRSLGGAGAGRPAARAGFGLGRSTSSEAFAGGRHLASVAVSQFAAQGTSVIGSMGTNMTTMIEPRWAVSTNSIGLHEQFPPTA